MSCSTLANPGLHSRLSSSHVVSPLLHSHSLSEHHGKDSMHGLFYSSFMVFQMQKHLVSSPASLFSPRLKHGDLNLR